MTTQNHILEVSKRLFGRGCRVWGLLRKRTRNSPQRGGRMVGGGGRRGGGGSSGGAKGVGRKGEDADKKAPVWSGADAGTFRILDKASLKTHREAVRKGR